MLIGITCDFETITDRRGCPTPRYVVTEQYVRAIETAGADSVLLPHVGAERAVGLLEKLDGLVISGGDFDVPPDYYGEEPHEHIGRLLEERSAFERALLEEALRRDMPTLGVCGGMQLLNVVLGGTLYQDLRQRPDTGVHEQPEDRRRPFHSAAVVDGTLLSRICDRSTLEINSTHHQAVRDLGRHLIASAVAPDGVIEAIEHTEHRFVVGVQWHPEALDAPEQQAIYSALVGSLSVESPGKPTK
ncbi:MAG: gamma-glutamyl-gamma-aminobutyrate hydrolase family protein [Myxococcota bacterium]